MTYEVETIRDHCPNCDRETVWRALYRGARGRRHPFPRDVAAWICSECGARTDGGDDAAAR